MTGAAKYAPPVTTPEACTMSKNSAALALVPDTDTASWDGKPFTVPMTFASPEAYIAGRTTNDVTASLAILDGAAMPGPLRRAILAALVERKARKAAAR